MGGGVPQLRYVIVVVDRGELIEASMSVRMRGRANERVRLLVLSVPGCLPRYLRLIITFFFGFPACASIIILTIIRPWMVEGLWREREREGGYASCIVLKHSFGESVA